MSKGKPNWTDGEPENAGIFTNAVHLFVLILFDILILTLYIIPKITHEINLDCY